METTLTNRGKSAADIVRDLFNRQEAAIIIPFVLITLFFYARNEAMLSTITISSILRTMAYPGLVAMGMVLLMITGEIDLSTSSVMSLSAVFAAFLMVVVGWPVWLSVVGALVAAAAVGLMNALITVKIGVNSLIVTMGSLFAVRGASYMFTQGVPIYPLSPQVAEFGDMRPLGISVAFFLMLIMMIIVQIVLNSTRWGAAVFATGGNKIAAQVCGISTDRVKIICFVLTSSLAGCAGLLLMSELPLPSGDPIIGRLLELDIIVGVILGGVSFYGGRGSAIGTFFGVLLIQVIRSGLSIAHFDPYWQVPILGALLLVAASVDVIRHKRYEA